MIELDSSGPGWKGIYCSYLLVNMSTDCQQVSEFSCNSKCQIIISFKFLFHSVAREEGLQIRTLEDQETNELLSPSSL